MDKPRTTPKDFFLWAGAMVSLYWCAIALIFLFFNYIDYAFPNALSPVIDPYSTDIPYEMASIVVLFPIYIALAWLIRKDAARDSSRTDIWVRRWALILTLFVAGATMAIDLIVLLTAFFRGDELTASFLLKVAVVLLVAAMAFMHFIADFWGYWAEFPERRRRVCTGVAVLAVASIVAGFFIVGTPAQARVYRLDAQKVTDLQTIQYQVVNYWQHKQALPGQLSDLNDPLSGMALPKDPQPGETYEYKATGPRSFELCATFNAPGYGTASPRAVVPEPAGLSGSLNENWQHGKGRTCFTRTIDPQLYPPIKNAQQ